MKFVEEKDFCDKKENTREDFGSSLFVWVEYCFGKEASKCEKRQTSSFSFCNETVMKMTSFVKNKML